MFGEAEKALVEYGVLGALVFILICLVIWVIRQFTKIHEIRAKDNERWSETVLQVTQKHNDALGDVRTSIKEHGDAVASAIIESLRDKPK